MNETSDNKDDREDAASAPGDDAAEEPAEKSAGESADKSARELAEDAAEESAEQSAQPVAGERLAAARREQQISVDEVAKELHLDEPKVRALERNQFESLGAPVFARGHLRKYALLVGISVDEAIAEYEALNQAPDDLPVVGLSGRAPRDVAPGPWLALVAIALVLGLAYWWFFVREPAAPGPATDPAADTELAAPSASTAPPEAAGQAGDAADEEEDTAEEETSEDRPADVPSDDPPEAQAEIVEPAPEAIPVAEGQSTLTIRFSGDCWTEVTDARGERLFFDLGREGRTSNLVGTPPFSVVVGDADNVSMALDGEAYDIPAAARSGRTARLTIATR